MQYLLAFFVGLFIIIGCSGEEEPVMKDPKWTKEESIEMNSNWSSIENEEINLFLKRHKDWNMTQTGTGLRYMIYEKSKNKDSAKIGDLVTVDFEISLLDGTVCYTSEDGEGPESFIVEKTDIESGLHEGVKFMTVDDRAKFILPSHIAHGLIGDTEKIPPLSPVIYDIHLLRIEKPEQ